jgi:hypothetical protein
MAHSFTNFARALRLIASTGGIGKRDEIAAVAELEALDSAITAVEGDVSTLETTVTGLRPLLHTANAKTADYVLALTDLGKVVEITVTTTANTVTIPANATVAFPVGTVLYVVSLGTGVTTLTAADGVTLNGAATGTLALTRYGMAMLYKQATNTWVAGQWNPVAFT